MKFFFGSYAHPDAEVSFEAINRTISYSSTQRANLLRESWALKGRIVFQGVTSQSQILAQVANLRNIYSVNGNSAGMLDNGGAQTIWLLDNSKAIGGVIVTNPISHSVIQGADGVTYLNYSFGLQMESFLSKLSDLLSYSETLSFSDINGGPLQVGRVPIYGLPIIQSISTNSFFYATQHGSLTQRGPNPSPEVMLFPYSLIGEDGSHSVTYSNPKMVRGVPVEYGVSWAYRYRQSTPFNGSVHTKG